MSEKRARADRRARREGGESRPRAKSLPVDVRGVTFDGVGPWVSTTGGDVPLYVIRGASTSHVPVVVVTPRG